MEYLSNWKLIFWGVWVAVFTLLTIRQLVHILKVYRSFNRQQRKYYQDATEERNDNSKETSC